MKPEKQTGQTKDTGFQFGIRKTFPFPVKMVWDFLFSEKGVNLWLGHPYSNIELKKSFRTKTGTECFVRVFQPYSHIRLNWKKQTWHNQSTMQLRVFGSAEKATISFHQEKLLDATQREEMKQHWNSVMEKLTGALFMNL
ncbi:MAG: SRPBCC domain-containing protein [Bacteroidales bacterium]|nr:SRPBCC domain-containing protein [Bacteroidales bacterium]MCF8405442.1 SRPBCC domain-containing protein [Bacteroidales bacterium]